jgi:hypothetical protein
MKKRERKIAKERDKKRERFFFEVFQQRMLQVFLSEKCTEMIRKMLKAK